MTVNRFDAPAENQYVNLYVPIPFLELYNIGKEYNKAVDLSISDLLTAITTWNNFKSPSAVDTQNWYDLTLRGAEEIANKLVNNLDTIKTPEGRLLIQNYINTRPYGTLRSLELSRDLMLLRLKNVQELIKDGTFNNAWHNLDLASYNTLENGIFSNTNVTPFKSTAELVKPYIDNIKDSYIRTLGGFDYYGVTPERIQSVIGSNLNALLTSPQGSEYIRQYIRAGYSPEDAQKIIANDFALAASKYAHENRRVNPFATMQYLDTLIRNRWADPNNPANKNKKLNNPENLNYLTNQLQITGNRAFSNGRIDVIARNPNYRTAVEHFNSQDSILKLRGVTELQALSDAYSTPQQLFRYIFDLHGTVTDNGGLKMNTDQLTAATNDVLNNFSTAISGTYGNLLLNTIPGISAENQTTPIGKYRVLSSGTNLDLATRSVAAIAGLNPTPSGRSKFLNELKGGGLNNMIVLGNERMIAIPTKDRFGNDTSLNMQTVRVAIPANEVKSRGLSDSDMKDAGAVLYTTPNKTTSSTTLSGEYDDKKTRTTFDKATSNTSITSGNSYWIVTLTSEIPMDAVGAEYLNQSALKETVNPTIYSSLYLDILDLAFSLMNVNENYE